MAAEVGFNLLAQRGARFRSTFAERCEVSFVQDHGIESHEFLALQPVYQKAWRCRKIGASELALYVAQPFYSAHVIIVVVTDQQSFRQAGNGFRIKWQWLGRETRRRGEGWCLCCGAGSGGCAGGEDDAPRNKATPVEHAGFSRHS
jgi:hypothetical protein